MYVSTHLAHLQTTMAQTTNSGPSPFEGYANDSVPTRDSVIQRMASETLSFETSTIQIRRPNFVSRDTWTWLSLETSR